MKPIWNASLAVKAMMGRRLKARPGLAFPVVAIGATLAGDKL
jgi:hypothetical protein